LWPGLFFLIKSNKYMVPTNIGRYVIERELGRGGMAVVYLASDPFVKRQVAIKLLPRQFTDDPQFRARFQREAQVIASSFAHVSNGRRRLLPLLIILLLSLFMILGSMRGSLLS
jgi:serine/threonine protein kinase